MYDLHPKPKGLLVWVPRRSRWRRIIHWHQNSIVRVCSLFAFTWQDERLHCVQGSLQSPDVARCHHSLRNNYCLYSQLRSLSAASHVSWRVSALNQFFLHPPCFLCTPMANECCDVTLSEAANWFQDCIIGISCMVCYSGIYFNINTKTQFINAVNGVSYSQKTANAFLFDPVKLPSKWILW